MTLAGWILMVLSLGFVVGLAAYCYWRVLATPATRERIHAPLEIDTREESD